MQIHIAVSLGYAVGLHLWMLLYFLVPEERKEELVTGLEERNGQGTNQENSWAEKSSLQCLSWA